MNKSAILSTVHRIAANQQDGKQFQWLVGGLIALLTFTAGLVASTAEPLLVGLMTGLIVVPLLLIKPRWAISALLILGLTSGVALSLLGLAFARLSWVVSLLGFFLLLPAALNMQNLKKAPAHIWIVVLFMLYAVGVTLLQWQSAAEALAGIKRYFLPYGLMLALALVPLSDKDFRHWRFLLISIALLQLPFALYEFLVLVPLRGGLAVGSAVTDVVAGTFGANLRGGSPNPVMALCLMVLLAFVLAWWKEGLIKLRWIFLSLPFILLPTVLGEVKIAFFMLPLVFIVVFKQEIIRRPAMFVGMLIMGALLLLLLGYALLEWVMREPLEHVIKDTVAYNFQNVGYGGLLLNRTTVLTFWWQQQGLHDPIGFMLGHGLGSAHLDQNALVAGHMAMKWPNHGIGLTSVSQLLWDLGVIGMAMYLLVLAAAWRTAAFLRANSKSRRVAADCMAIQAAIALFALMIIYNDNLVVLPSLQILLAAILGYLAHLFRDQR